MNFSTLAGWQEGTQDRIKARPHWVGLSGREDDGDHFYIDN